MKGRSAFAFALVELVAGCAGPSPPPAAPSPARPSQGTLIERAKTETRDYFCNPDSPPRRCVAIPSDAACAETFEALWPACARGLVLHEGPDTRDHEAGRVVGRCMSDAFVAKYGRSGSAECK
jgi:hypothetical protein